MEIKIDTVEEAIERANLTLLNSQVADIIGWEGNRPTPAYSTDPAAAMEAWEWLENNNPWKPSVLALMRSEGNPAVVRIDYEPMNEIAFGVSYPHAIALAVVEAGKVLGVIG